MPPAPPVIPLLRFISRPGCCLAGSSKFMLDRIKFRVPYELCEVDAWEEANHAVKARYGEELPAVEVVINGEAVEACREGVQERAVVKLLKEAVKEAAIYRAGLEAQELEDGQEEEGTKQDERGRQSERGDAAA